MNRPANITQGEIARAVRAARQAGGDTLAVEIARDGTIRIVPVEKAQKRFGQIVSEVAPAKEIVL